MGILIYVLWNELVLVQVNDGDSEAVLCTQLTSCSGETSPSVPIDSVHRSQDGHLGVGNWYMLGLGKN